MPKTIELKGDWSLKNRAGNYALTATVPGDTHTALLTAGKIPDPFWARNELDLQWIGREDWIYERSFEVTAELLDAPSLFLHIDSLDTVATIFVNDKELTRTKNAFVGYRFEVKSFLRAGTNQIRIEIEAPELAALAENKKMAYPIPMNYFPVQSPHRNLLRKTQCHGGWDWGPSLMVSGIYGEIYIGATSLGRIDYVYTDQEHDATGVDLTVTCEVQSPAGGASTYEVQLGEQIVRMDVQLQSGLNVLQQKIRIASPKLWWPNGYGEQALYNLTVRVGGDTRAKKIGFRTIEVDQTQDERGQAFTFVVNGVPIFAKGACWVPADALPQRQTVEAMDDLLTSAVQAHMNMIRVWGGGQYEPDAFFDLCDEKGLLVWQDFMFTCALYPSTKEFLNLVRAEVTHQAKRLRDHASLALWCGSNENLGALNWYDEPKANRDRYVIDYDLLVEGAVGDTIRELDPKRLYWPCSPCAGSRDFTDCWNTDNRGDMHCWFVWGEDKSFDKYLTINPRFLSEFGFQSFPSMELIRTFAPEDQLNASSPVMDHHERVPYANMRFHEQFARYFRYPDKFENFVFATQIQQAFGLKIAIEHFRRLRPLCMGSLYWQLNDVWPVTSWASIEYGGKWKPLQYLIKRLYAPVLISVRQTATEVEIWVDNDQQVSLNGIVDLSVMTFNGKALSSEKLPVTVAASTSLCVAKYPLTDLTPKLDEAFLAVELKAGEIVAHNDHFFTEYKKCTLPKVEIAMQVVAAGEGFHVTLQTDFPAFWVTVNAERIRGEFDDNSFALLPGRSRTLTFQPKEKVTLEQFKSRLTVSHLRNTYA